MRSLERSLLLAVGLVVLASGASAQTEATASVQDSVFTEAQARRGEKTYSDVCIACHIPEWFADTFLDSWNGTTAAALYELISTTMPEDRPGGLKSRQYADVLAYIFAMNGLPAGARELPSEKQALEKILIEWRE